MHIVKIILLCLSIGASVIVCLSWYFLPSRNWEKHQNDTTALAIALYYEGAISESLSGLWAIASVIENRRKSKDFPNTIYAVVAQGATAGKRNGCQFSFMCDGQSESIFYLCEVHELSMKKYWGRLGCFKRWTSYLSIALSYRAIGFDNTNGAVLYYTGPTPYWAIDFVEGSVTRIGSHTFGQSKWLGRDLQQKHAWR